MVEDFFCYDEKRIILWNNREVLLILQRDSGEKSVIHIFDARWWASVVVSYSTEIEANKIFHERTTIILAYPEREGVGVVVNFVIGLISLWPR